MRFNWEQDACWDVHVKVDIAIRVEVDIDIHSDIERNADVNLSCPSGQQFAFTRVSNSMSNEGRLQRHPGKCDLESLRHDTCIRKSQTEL